MVRMGKGVGKRWKRPRGCKESGLGRPRVGCVWAGETKKGFKSKTKWITWAPSGPRDSRAKDPSFCGSNIREPDYLRHCNTTADKTFIFRRWSHNVNINT